MPSCGAQRERNFLCSLVKLNPLAKWSSERTNSEGWEFELGLQTGCLDCVCVILLSLSRKVLETHHDRFLVSPYVPHSQLPFLFHSHAPITSAVKITSLGTSNSIPEYIIYRNIVQTDTRVITAVTVQSMNWGGWCSGVRISLLQATIVQQPI